MRIAAPRPPDTPAPYRFPVVGVLAPVVAAGALWLVTSSPFVLLFAVLGPVTAVASLADAKLGGRRARRGELQRYRRETAEVLERVAAAHDAERDDLRHAAPPASAIRAPDAVRWVATVREPVHVTVGTGRTRSTIDFDAGPPAEGEAALELTRTAEAASTLHDAPVVVDARLGIGIVGPPVLAAAAVRSLVVGVARVLSPAEHWMSADPALRVRLPAVPHPPGRVAVPGAVAFGERGEPATVLIATAADEASLPGRCRVVVRVGAGSAIVRHPDRSAVRELLPDLLAWPQAASWSRDAAAAAARDGLVASGGLPERVDLAGLPVAGPRGLSATIGADAVGPVTIDLVADGPHAVVGGTTGSGKSAFLVAWVLAMATAHPPDRLTVLLVDFKGGAAFARLAGLPHTVGVVTDLDEAEAQRALASLRAELRRRERALLAAGAVDIDGAPELARLVIVVDEFAAMLAEHPDLHALFADIAARGRALGVHLVLCTQRPATAVRDAVLANADLRICLRVNNRADSTSVIGTDDAAAIPASLPGRAMLSVAGEQPRPMQSALSDDDDVSTATAAHAGAPRPAPPWLPPLPSVIDPAAVAGFGLVDVPDEQRREPAVWQGPSVLVLGAAGSGVSTALSALGGPDAFRMPGEPAAAWDALGALASAAHRIVVVDDVDALLARFDPEYRGAVVERLVALLRDGPGRGLRLAIGARRVTGELQAPAALCHDRLVLRHASRHDVLLAGAEAADHRPGLPPGGGSWRGRRVQVVLAPVGTDQDPRAAVAALDDRPIVVVSTRPASVLRSLPGAVPLATVIDPTSPPAGGVVGDVEEWQSHWGLLPVLRGRAQVLLEHCGPAEFRAVTRSRELPPPLPAEPGLAWRWELDGSVVRVRLPGAQASASASAT